MLGDICIIYNFVIHYFFFQNTNVFFGQNKICKSWYWTNSNLASWNLIMSTIVWKCVFHYCSLYFWSTWYLTNNISHDLFTLCQSLLIWHISRGLIALLLTFGLTTLFHLFQYAYYTLHFLSTAIKDSVYPTNLLYA